MIKTDLKAAGIPYEVDGKYADFHCLRHSTATLLIQTGANPKVIQSLMRHSDLNLTMSKYTHLYAGQQREIVESLPDFVVQQDRAVMTGTYDCVEENRAEKNCPKTANQSEKFRTNPNNSWDTKSERDTGFNQVSRDKTAFSGYKHRPPFSRQKIGATGLEPATS